MFPALRRLGLALVVALTGLALASEPTSPPEPTTAPDWENPGVFGRHTHPAIVETGEPRFESLGLVGSDGDSTGLPCSLCLTSSSTVLRGLPSTSSIAK